MQDFSIIDPFNLRFFIKNLCDFLSQNDENSIRTTLDFLEILFDGIGQREQGKKPKHISDVQKVLSGNLPWEKCDYLLDDSEHVHQNCKMIASEIEKNPNYRVFLNGLVSRASRKFFDEQELEKLSAALNENATQEIVYLFVCHGFQNLNRIPAQLAGTLYEEAQSLDFDQPLRYSLLKEAAVCGSKEAALEFGNFAIRLRDRPLSADEIQEGFTYTMMASPLPPALWNLAFLLEQGVLTEKQIALLKDSVKIDAKIAGLNKQQQEELAFVSCAEEAYELAYKINFYLASKGFTKAYNSLAKFLSLDKYSFQLINNECFKDKSALIEFYYRKAIAGGNILAMHNFANVIIKRKPIKEADAVFAEDLLKTAIRKGMRSSYATLGLLYLETGKPEQAKACLTRALEYGGRKGLILYKLGVLEQKLEEKSKFFLKAIQEGYADAAIDYALCEHNIFNLDNKTIHLRNAINILQQFSLTASIEKRDIFIDIQNNLEEILEKVEIGK